MQTGLSPSVCRAFLGCQIEKAVDELNLTKKIISCHPSSLPLPDHVDCFVALNRSPSRLEFSEALLGVHSTFDGSMILFQNVVQVLHRSMSTMHCSWCVLDCGEAQFWKRAGELNCQDSSVDLFQPWQRTRPVRSRGFLGRNRIAVMQTTESRQGDNLVATRRR
jgi:hypothetical protein